MHPGKYEDGRVGYDTRDAFKASFHTHNVILARSLPCIARGRPTRPSQLSDHQNRSATFQNLRAAIEARNLAGLRLAIATAEVAVGIATQSLGGAAQADEGSADVGNVKSGVEVDDATVIDEAKQLVRVMLRECADEVRLKKLGVSPARFYRQVHGWCWWAVGGGWLGYGVGYGR